MSKPLPQRTEPSYVWDEKSQTFRDSRGREPETHHALHKYKKQDFLDLIYTQIHDYFSNTLWGGEGEKNINNMSAKERTRVLQRVDLEKKLNEWWWEKEKLISSILGRGIPTSVTLTKILQKTLLKNKYFGKIFSKPGAIDSIVRNIVKSPLWISQKARDKKYHTTNSHQIKRQVTENEKLLNSRLKQLITEEIHKFFMEKNYEVNKKTDKANHRRAAEKRT